MKAIDIMSSPVVTVTLDDNLFVVYDVFESTKFHHVLVVEDKRLFGVVSDRDLLKALSPNIGTAAEKSSDTATLNKKVHQVMSRKPISIKPDANIYKALEICEQHNVSCIPVIDDDAIPVGIISWRDIVKALLKAKK